MADIFWDRLEPHTRSEQLEEGLQVRIADTLWMLARQWQVGEVRGEDAASPIHARVRVAWAPIVSFRNEAVTAPQVERLPEGRPLEARVEAEPVVTGPSALRLAADAGLSLLRRLDAAALSHLRVGLRKQFGLEVSPQDLRGLPERDVRRLRLLSRRALDGRKLLVATDADLQRAGATASEMPSLRTVLQAFRDEVGARFVEPGRSGDVWADERLEYAFSVAAAAGPDEVVLGAPDTPEGTWTGSPSTSTRQRPTVSSATRSTRGSSSSCQCRFRMQACRPRAFGSSKKEESTSAASKRGLPISHGLSSPRSRPSTPTTGSCCRCGCQGGRSLGCRTSIYWTHSARFIA